MLKPSNTQTSPEVVSYCTRCGRKFLSSSPFALYCSNYCRNAARKEKSRATLVDFNFKCPWENGEISGETANTDPVLGF